MVPLFHVFDKPLSVYMIAALVGALFALFTTYRLSVKHGLDEIRTLKLTFLCFCGAGVGGALLYGVTNIRLLLQILSNLRQFESLQAFFQAMGIVFGGSVFYGGLLGILLTVWIYIKRNRLSHRYYDVTAVGVSLFHIFGRIGCFLTGCCYGIESKLGFVYHFSPAEAANGIRRFPVQLLEASCNTVLFAVLFWLFRKKKAEGYLMNVYLYAYPTIRFLDEFLRGDSYRGIVFGLSTSQWISIFLLIGNTLNLLYRSRKRSLLRKDPAAPNQQCRR